MKAPRLPIPLPHHTPRPRRHRVRISPQAAPCNPCFLLQVTQALVIGIPPIHPRSCKYASRSGQGMKSGAMAAPGHSSEGCEGLFRLSRDRAWASRLRVQDCSSSFYGSARESEGIALEVQVIDPFARPPYTASLLLIPRIGTVEDGVKREGFTL